MATSRAMRLGEPVAALPAAQSVRTDAEHDRCRICPDPAHRLVIALSAAIRKVRNRICRLAVGLRVKELCRLRRRGIDWRRFHWEIWHSQISRAVPVPVPVQVPEAL